MPNQLSMDDVVFLEQQAESASTVVPAGYAGSELAQPYSPYSSPSVERVLAPLSADPAMKFKKGADGAWIVVASGADRENVLSVAQAYLQDFPSTLVVRTGNGRYAVLIGWSAKARALELKSALLRRSILPSDTYLSAGESYGQPIWSADARNISSRADLMQYSLLRLSPQLLGLVNDGSGAGSSISQFSAQVTGLSDPLNGFLSLRNEPNESSPAVRRLPSDTPLQVVSRAGGWLKVNLLNGLSGWVQSSYVTTGNQSVASNSDEEIEESDIGPVPGTKSNIAIDQARIDKIVSDAKTLIDDVDVFLKQHPDVPNIVVIASSMADLQTALDKSDVPGVEAAVSSLNKKLKDTPNYEAYKQERLKERQEAEFTALSEAVREGKQNSYLMTRYVAQNVRSSSVAVLVPLMKEYERILASSKPSLEELTKLNERFATTINEQNIQREFEQLKVACGDKCGEAPEKVTEDSQKLFQVTDKNRVILEGDAGDFIVLYNASTAPHVIRNLRGEFVFDKDLATACYLHSMPEKEVDTAAVKVLVQLGAKKVGAIAAPCLETNLSQYDLIVGRRGDILKQKTSYVYPLWSLLEQGTFQIMTVTPAMEFSALSSHGGALAIGIVDALKKGQKSGFGILKTGLPSDLVCLVSPASDDAHFAAIAERTSDLNLYINGFHLKTATTLDDAFVQVKRGQCGAVYASAADLATLITALERDGITYSAVPVWLENGAIDHVRKKLEEKRKVAAQAEAEDRRKKEDEALLEKKRAADLAATKAAVEKKLRDENGAAARARANEIQAQFDLLRKPDKNWFESYFPKTASWYQQQGRDGWEFVQAKVDVADFGSSKWKERTLDATQVTLNVEMKNSVLGENKTFCYNLGLIFDDEYHLAREPVEAECNGATASFAEWKRGWSFASKWNAPN